MPGLREPVPAFGAKNLIAHPPVELPVRIDVPTLHRRPIALMHSAPKQGMHDTAAPHKASGEPAGASTPVPKPPVPSKPAQPANNIINAWFVWN